MPSRRMAHGDNSGESIAAFADNHSRKRTMSTGTGDPKNDSKTSDLVSKLAGLTLPKDHQALSTPKPDETTAQTPSPTKPNNASAITCTVCTRLNRILPCCAALSSTHPCPDCTSISLLLPSISSRGPKTERQAKEDHIERLKLSTKQFEAENERLLAVLAQKKTVLREKRDELYGKKPEGPKILKKLGRAKAVALRRKKGEEKV